MGLYSYPRKRKTGSSVRANKTEIKYIDQEFSAVIPGTYEAIASLMPLHYFNRWFAMTPGQSFYTELEAAVPPAPDPPVPPVYYPNTFFTFSNDYAAFADAGSAVAAYDSSAFSLTIPQGTDAHSRIGNVVQVMKDKWYLRVRPIVSSTSVGYDGEGLWQSTAAVADFLSERPFRVRAVCIFQDRIDIPGRQWLNLADIFEFPNRLQSRLDPGTGKGFSVVYDKTLTFQGIRPQTAALESTTSHGVEVQNSRTDQAEFGFTTRYVRQYADQAEDPDDLSATAAGVECVAASPSAPLSAFVDHRGVTRGQLQWFFYIEDNYGTLYTPMDPNNELACPVNRNFYPSLGFEIYVLRKTAYADD